LPRKLRIPLTAYREVLSYLEDLEIGLYAERREEAGEEELVYLPNGIPMTMRFFAACVSELAGAILGFCH